MSELDKQITILSGSNDFTSATPTKKVHIERARITAPEYDFNAWNAVLEMYAHTPEMDPEDLIDAAQTRGDKIVEVEATANVRADLQGKHGEVRRYPDRIEAIYDAGQQFIVVPQLSSPNPVTDQEVVTTSQEIAGLESQSMEATPVLKGFQIVASNDKPVIADEQQNAIAQFILGKKAA